MIPDIQSTVTHLQEYAKALEADQKSENADSKQILTLVYKELETLSGLARRAESYAEVSQLIEALPTLQLLDSTAGKTMRLGAEIVETSGLIRTAKKRTEILEHHPDFADRSHKVEAKLAFFLDLDSADHNGVIGKTLFRAVKNRVPIITTRSLLSGIDCVHHPELGEEFRKELFATQEQWEIYEKNDVIVLIPKDMVTGSNSKERLRSLDLVVDGSLHPTSALSACSGPKGEGSIDDLVSVFSEKPRKRKVIFAMGHGGPEGTQIGMSSQNHEKFLRLLNRQNVAALRVTSCFSGGKPSLDYISDVKPGSSVADASNWEEARGADFPVIVHSIGDMPTLFDKKQTVFGVAYKTLADPLSKWDFNKDLDALAVLFSGREKTFPEVREAFSSIVPDEGLPGQNLTQVYFPSTPRAPMGFRPISDSENSQALTYGTMRHTQFSGEKAIKVEGKTFLEVSPVVVDHNIQCDGKNPILLSAVPGNARHFINRLDLGDQPLNKWLAQQGAFYKSVGLSACKLFHIRELQAGGEIFRNVVLYMDPSTPAFGGVYCLCEQEEGHTHLYGGGTLVGPTSRTHAFLCVSSWLEKAKPSNEAVRAATTGQQSDRMFTEASKQLLKPSKTLMPAYEGKAIDLAKFIKEETQRAEPNGLSSPEWRSLFGGLLFLALEQGNDQLFDQILNLDPSVNKSKAVDEVIGEARKLAEIEPLSLVNAKRLGTPLIYYAASNDYPNAVQRLVGEGADVNGVNVASVNKLTPLQVAAAKRYNGVVEALMEAEGIDLNAESTAGLTALHYAAAQGNIDACALLQERGMDINLEVSSDKPLWPSTPLVLAMMNKLPPHILQALIDLGADPLKGNPSPFTVAIRARNLDAVHLFIEAGTVPKGNSLLAAVESGTPAILEMLLNCMKAKYSENELRKLLSEESRGELIFGGARVSDKFRDLADVMESPVLSVIYFSNWEKVSLLVDNGAYIPDSAPKDFIDQLPERLRQLDEANNSTKLSKWLNSPSSKPPLEST